MVHHQVDVGRAERADRLRGEGEAHEVDGGELALLLVGVARFELARLREERAVDVDLLLYRR